MSCNCREKGYAMPAEWKRHDAIWLAWPYDPTTFPERVPKVEATYVQIVKEIHESEDVNIFVIDEPTKKKATKMFEQAGIDMAKVHIWVSDYADVWFRDYGPIFVKNPKHELAMIHWDFNSWGDKYRNPAQRQRNSRRHKQRPQINLLQTRHRVGGRVD